MPKKNNYRGLFIASMVLSIFWLLSIILSVGETFLVGLGIWYSPTFFISLYMAIEDLTGNGASILTAIQTFFSGLVALPFVLFISSFIFAPVAIIAMVLYGTFFFFALVYSAISFVCLAINMAFCIGLLATSAKAKSKQFVNEKAAKAAKVFAILGLVSLLFAGMPNVLSLISIFRYIVMIVACILAIVGCGKAIKAKQEETEIIEV